MNDITVLILAGGDSTRFWPLKNKVFTKFLGKPVLYYRLKQLERYKFSDIVIVGSKETEFLFTRFRHQYPEFSYKYINQSDSHGMAGAVLSAKEYIQGKKILIVKPVDIIEDILFEQLKDYLQKGNYIDGLLTGIHVNSYYPGGYLMVDEDNVNHIFEKPGKDNMPADLVRIVFDYFQSSDLFLEYLDSSKSQKDDLYEIALENMISEHKKIKFMDYKGYWGYLNYPWHVLSVMNSFFQNLKPSRGRNLKIHTNVTINEPVIIEDGVTILENVKIIGPCYIGRNTMIGNNSIIRESSLGENCVIGFSTEITRSHIGDNCWFHSNYIGDSILDEDVGVGGHATFANFRLDEQSVKSKVGRQLIDTNQTKLGAIIGPHVRIGVGALIMPGVKVGADSFIGAAVTLTEDLPDNKAVFIKQTHTIKQNREKITRSSRESLRRAMKI